MPYFSFQFLTSSQEHAFGSVTLDFVNIGIFRSLLTVNNFPSAVVNEKGRIVVRRSPAPEAGVKTKSADNGANESPCWRQSSEGRETRFRTCWLRYENLNS